MQPRWSKHKHIKPQPPLTRKNTLRVSLVKVAKVALVVNFGLNVYLVLISVKPEYIFKDITAVSVSGINTTCNISNSSASFVPANLRSLEGSYDNDVDTSIIITSSLIPTHPSIFIINETIQSLHYLRGLSLSAPIFIAIDGPNSKATPPDLERFEGYVQNLKMNFNQSRHRIVLATENIGLTGNVKQAMDLVKTEFVYVLQHDFSFIRPVDHLAVIKSMQEYPSTLRMVRFNKRSNIPIAWDKGACFGVKTSVDTVNGLNFTKTAGWSDNNHLTWKSYYEEVFAYLRNYRGPMEEKMIGLAKQNCSYWGPFLYGARGESAMIKHLNGRGTKG